MPKIETLQLTNSRGRVLRRLYLVTWRDEHGKRQKLECATKRRAQLKVRLLRRFGDDAFLA
jgi:hypothetical protein